MSCLVHTNKHSNCTNAQSSKLLFTSQQGQSLLPVTPWSQSVSNRWFGIVCHIFFDTLTDKLCLILCDFLNVPLLFRQLDFFQVAAPAANAALLAGLVANLSTETVPVRGSRDRRVFNVHKGLQCSAHRDFIN